MRTPDLRTAETTFAIWWAMDSRAALASCARPVPRVSPLITPSPITEVPVP
jgi:hypothetical protein